jgi:phage gpG-like protein
MQQLLEAVEGLDNNVEAGLPVLGEIIQTAVEEVIQTEGAAGTDGPWEPFSPTTLKLNPKRRGGQLLQDTGLLARLQIRRGMDWVEVRSPAPYAGFHVTGVRQNGIPNLGPVPARNFLAIDLGRILERAAEAVAAEIAER